MSINIYVALVVLIIIGLIMINKQKKKLSKLVNILYLFIGIVSSIIGVDILRKLFRLLEVAVKLPVEDFNNKGLFFMLFATFTCLLFGIGILIFGVNIIYNGVIGWFKK